MLEMTAARWPRGWRRKTGQVFLALHLALLAACGSTAPPPRVQAPADFSLFLGLGREDGTASRCELWLEPKPGGERLWSLRLRRAAPGKLPLLFDRVALRELPGHRVDRLYRDLIRAHAFAVPTWLENAPLAEAAPLTLSMRSRGARRHCCAIGRMDDRLLRALRTIDGWSPLRLAPWPDWLAPYFSDNDPRAELVADAEAAVRMHRAWLAEKPDFTRLHLDLFALFVMLGRDEYARFELEQLPAELRQSLGDRVLPRR
ncbi:MAG: hypothetical protein CSA62_13235 [Planctomycetota bacterium]|nr:MAG: hypothetical protein CSA62_13235 [Planctomycetota bacterium]